MRGGRTRVSQYVNVNPRYKLQQTFNGGVESYVSVAGVFYKVHTFSATGTLSFGSQAAEGLDTEYLVVAGGGGAGGSLAGGGGAGGYRSSVVGESTGGGGTLESKLSLVPGSYTVTVGAGGAGGQSVRRKYDSRNRWK
jgi:hypothetical protein